ncbi:mitochondrial inner membrane protease subunit 2 isoform X3 [Fopius arisanus]|uniref:Mitochondrial inner membrane protease subunit 2 n=1 Tax=Fopius arisanus TaxID=64838 RepID=A0A9R1TPG4_9HYME|nr:PREDICTED: mitochondrial inner membrane protease subunit 2 isoform X3 [Fopius arisanus]
MTNLNQPKSILTRKNSQLMGLSSIVRNILLGIPIGVTFVNTVGYVARVEGISMQPALNPNAKEYDYVFLNCWTVHNYNINYEGDEVRTIGYHTSILRVPEGHCWVEGDNTNHSVDSNTFGPLSLGLVIAKATHVVWPPSRWQHLNSLIPKHRSPLRVSKQSQPA